MLVERFKQECDTFVYVFKKNVTNSTEINCKEARVESGSPVKRLLQ